MPDQKNTRDACPACGTWTCDECGARRRYANRFSSKAHLCPRCGSPNGRMLRMRHDAMRTLDHREGIEKLVSDGVTPRYPL